MGGGAERAGRVHREHRRFDGTVDQRSMGLDAAPRGESSIGCQRFDAAPIHRIFPPAELGRGNSLHPDLPCAGREAEICAGEIRGAPDAEIPQHGEDGRDGGELRFAISTSGSGANVGTRGSDSVVSSRMIDPRPAEMRGMGTPQFESIRKSRGRLFSITYGRFCSRSVSIRYCRKGEKWEEVAPKGGYRASWEAGAPNLMASFMMRTTGIGYHKVTRSRGRLEPGGQQTGSSERIRMTASRVQRRNGK